MKIMLVNLILGEARLQVFIFCFDDRKKCQQRKQKRISERKSKLITLKFVKEIVFLFLHNDNEERNNMDSL